MFCCIFVNLIIVSHIGYLLPLTEYPSIISPREFRNKENHHTTDRKYQSLDPLDRILAISSDDKRCNLLLIFQEKNCDLGDPIAQATSRRWKRPVLLGECK
jgi:hypothetical protein